MASAFHIRGYFFARKIEYEAISYISMADDSFPDVISPYREVIVILSDGSCEEFPPIEKIKIEISRWFGTLNPTSFTFVIDTHCDFGALVSTVILDLGAQIKHDSFMNGRRLMLPKIIKHATDGAQIILIRKKDTPCIGLTSFKYRLSRRGMSPIIIPFE